MTATRPTASAPVPFPGSRQPTRPTCPRTRPRRSTAPPATVGPFRSTGPTMATRHPARLPSSGFTAGTRPARRPWLTATTGRRARRPPTRTPTRAFSTTTGSPPSTTTWRSPRLLRSRAVRPADDPTVRETRGRLHARRAVGLHDPVPARDERDPGRPADDAGARQHERGSQRVPTKCPPRERQADVRPSQPGQPDRV